MRLRFDEYPHTVLTYLSREDVVRCVAELDPVELVADALRRHSAGGTLLPDEAYLGWQTPDGAAARSLAMPGGIHYDDHLALGTKIINGSLGNSARGLARSQGLLLMHDPEVAWPRVVMESAFVSSLRTAAVSAVAAVHLGSPDLTRLAVIGCGTLAKVHLVVLADALPQLTEIVLFDTDPRRAEAMAQAARDGDETGRLKVSVAAGARECVAGAHLVVTTTTVTEGYLPYEWLTPGALVAHVSLDDVLPDVVHRAGVVLVDDWNLVAHDHRRLLGRMYREGTLRAPGGEYHPDAPRDRDARQVDGTLGDVLHGTHPGRRDPDEVILSNPFGMSILDVAVGDRVAATAARLGLGQELRM
ncbi:MAG TPA: ornithine cyclodeaminase [Pseudonocardiaceae bacterium]